MIDAGGQLNHHAGKSIRSLLRHEGRDMTESRIRTVTSKWTVAMGQDNQLKPLRHHFSLTAFFPHRSLPRKYTRSVRGNARSPLEGLSAPRRGHDQVSIPPALGCGLMQIRRFRSIQGTDILVAKRILSPASCISRRRSDHLPTTPKKSFLNDSRTSIFRFCVSASTCSIR